MLIQPAFVFADVPAAVTYLQGQTQSPWITMALVAAGQSSVPTDHLLSVSGTLATDYAKAVLALAAAGENPTTFGSVDYVTQLKSYHNNSQMGDAGLLNDDMWSILALASVNQVGSIEASDAKAFLITNQNTDGGWGYNVGGDSDTNDTAAAIIALVEAGVSASDAVITNAVAYLQSVQNDDGGIGYYTGNDSDTNSTSWVVWAIRKLSQNPSSWVKNSNNPIGFLESMQNSDGSFGRTSSNTSANLLSTHDAVIALSDVTLPLGYYQEVQAGEYLLRIEGSVGPICNKFLTGATAYDLLVAGQDECGYTFSGNRDYGTFFLDSINDIENNFPSYWMYLVNNDSTDDGLEQYLLEPGDEILIYYDLDTNSPSWPDFDRPLRIDVDQTEIDPGQVTNVMVEYFNGIDWLPLPNAVIKVNDETKTTNASGQLPLTIYENGIYQVYADTPDYIRSEKITITVGDTVSQNIGLQVEIDQSGGDGGGRIGGEAIALVVTPGQLNFGTLQPGETASQDLNLSNEGTVSLNLSATVFGNSIFTENVKINDEAWIDFSESLIAYQSKTANASLTVPSNYLASGIKSGELIIWATAD